MSSTLESADERLLNAHDLARAALLEITPESTIGEPVGHTIEEGGVVSLRFQPLCAASAPNCRQSAACATERLAAQATASTTTARAASPSHPVG